jgi:hypothetical protein
MRPPAAAAIRAGEGFGLFQLGHLHLPGAQADHAAAQDGTDARLLHVAGHLVHVVVHIDKGGRSRFQHLGDGQEAPPAHMLGGKARFEGPHLLLEPRLKRQVVGVAAEEGHRRVAVGVDEAGQHHAAAAVDGLVVGRARLLVGGGPDIRDDAVLEGHGAVLDYVEGGIGRDDRDSIDDGVHRGSPFPLTCIPI